MKRLRVSAWAMMLVLLAGGVGWSQRGQRIARPEALAGRWEAPDGEGGAVGMNVVVEAHAAGAVKGLVGEPLYLDDLTFGVYRRTAAEIAAMGFNFFTDDPKWAATKWDGKRLVIQLHGAWKAPDFNIDLIWDERAATWTGHFERGAFSRNVVLRRPVHVGAANPFVGTWSDSNGLGMNNCVHVAQQADGGLTAWADDLYLPGLYRYANGLRPPEQSRERYGEIAKVSQEGKDTVTVELRAYSAGCCSHSFRAKLSADSKELDGSWLEGAFPVNRAAIWKKMAGNSCVSALPGGRP